MVCGSALLTEDFAEVRFQPQVREMKEKLAYVAIDPKTEQKLAEETTVVMRSYTLPDGYLNLKTTLHCK